VKAIASFFGSVLRFLALWANPLLILEEPPKSPEALAGLLRALSGSAKFLLVYPESAECFGISNAVFTASGIVWNGHLLSDPEILDFAQEHFRYLSGDGWPLLRDVASSIIVCRQAAQRAIPGLGLGL